MAISQPDMVGYIDNGTREVGDEIVKKRKKQVRLSLTYEVIEGLLRKQADLPVDGTVTNVYVDPTREIVSVVIRGVGQTCGKLESPGDYRNGPAARWHRHSESCMGYIYEGQETPEVSIFELGELE